MKSTIFLALTASPLALAATAMPVAAQDSADQSTANAGLDDIVVTARRREESLQSVPVSITAISSDMLEQKSVQDLSDVATLKPGLRLERKSVVEGKSVSVLVDLGGSRILKKKKKK